MNLPFKTDVTANYSRSLCCVENYSVMADVSARHIRHF